MLGAACVKRAVIEMIAAAATTTVTKRSRRTKNRASGASSGNAKKELIGVGARGFRRNCFAILTLPTVRLLGIYY
jgi:hypothetical protein